MPDRPGSNRRNPRQPSWRMLTFCYLAGLAIAWVPALLSAADGTATPAKWTLAVSLTAFLNALAAVYAAHLRDNR